MLIAFCKYFFKFIFKAKTRQGLLFLAIFGLFISSFALLVLQSTMGGLQNKLIKRSKKVTGTASIWIKDKNQDTAKEIVKILKENKINSIAEYELELLLKHGDYLSPVVVHALDNRKDERPEFLKELMFKEIVIPRDLSIKLGIDTGDKIRLISPSHVDSLMGDIPRMVTVYIDDHFISDVPDVDIGHVWVRLGIIQNLVRARSLNQVRLFSEHDKESVLALLSTFENIRYQSWEERNKTLVWSLSLETTMMVFLFSSMTLLVTICIASGLLIFFEKTKTDLASFWILGTDQRRINFSTHVFLQFLNIFSIGSGLILGFCFLYVLDKYGLEIMPAVFMDRKIPVFITFKGVFVSFIIPYLISSTFGYFILSNFNKKQNYMDFVKAI